MNMLKLNDEEIKIIQHKTFIVLYGFLKYELYVVIHTFIVCD